MSAAATASSPPTSLPSDPRPKLAAPSSLGSPLARRAGIASVAWPAVVLLLLFCVQPLVGSGLIPSCLVLVGTLVALVLSVVACTCAEGEGRRLTLGIGILGIICGASLLGVIVWSGMLVQRIESEERERAIEQFMRSRDRE